MSTGMDIRTCCTATPGCFLSATYYVKVPEAMKGGEIVFRDPRGPALAIYETLGIESMGSTAWEYLSHPPPVIC